MNETTSLRADKERLEGKLVDGRFFIQRRLGSGSFGTVYLAEQRVFNLALRPVALKLFHGALINPENAAEVLNDAVVLFQLQQEPTHAENARHLVTVFDAGFLNERPAQAFMAMEYVAGYRGPGGGTIRTLAGLIRSFKPVPVDLALNWMIQVLRPVAWMHTLPHVVLHCDLKPDNVLVADKDTLKVADFGFAQLAFGIVGSTSAGGALSCQAPETLAGLYPTPASDVYSLGLIFYEILAGKNPLTKVGLEALAARRHDEYRNLQIQARQQGLPPLTECKHPELADHPLLLEIIDRCLLFTASRRYDNAAALFKAVEDYARGEGVAVLQHEVVEIPEAAPAPTLDRLMSEAEVLVRQGKFEQVRARCERAQTEFPKSGRPYQWLAEIHLAQKQAEKALAVCSKGLGIDPNEPELLDVVADAYDMLNQPTVAEKMRADANLLRQNVRH